MSADCFKVVWFVSLVEGYVEGVEGFLVFGVFFLLSLDPGFDFLDDLLYFGADLAASEDREYCENHCHHNKPETPL